MKIKYKYNAHHMMDTYPTEEDVLFDICTFLSEKGRISEEFSDLGIKVAFKKKIEEVDADKLLTSLAVQGFLHQRLGAGKRKYYTVIKHPFGDFFGTL